MNKKLFVGLGVAIITGLYFQLRSVPTIVLQVEDGDSIIVTNNERVRLSHIDAPESNQPWGEESTYYVKRACLGENVKLLRKGNDIHGRTLAEVVLPDGKILNQELVRYGLAWHYRQYSSDSFYQQLEFEARAKKRGLWAEARPVAPWNWRHQRR